MALLYDSRLRAFDNDGDPLPGAKLHVYEAGGLTPADLYADADLNAPQTNPVEADGAGRFPQVFVAQELFDMELKTAGGVTVASYENVSGLGEADGAIERNFTNSRLRISGSGGVVSIEARPATGDNIGGSMRLGGSDGTAADSIELDGPVSTTGDVDVAGVMNAAGITLGGKGLRGVVEANAAFTAVSELIIPLSNVPADVRQWVIELIDLIASTDNTALRAVLSYDNGATYKTGASDYGYNSLRFSDATAPFMSRSNASALIPFGALDNTNAATLDIKLTTRVSGVGHTILTCTMNTWYLTDPPDVLIVSGRGVGNYGRATHLKLYPAAGTITGRYRVTPQRGWGE